eukprot:1141749-Pelagomonas_calceolata.AAC.7
MSMPLHGLYSLTHPNRSMWTPRENVPAPTVQRKDKTMHARCGRVDYITPDHSDGPVPLEGPQLGPQTDS